MKKLLLVAALAVGLGINAQIKKTTLFDKKFGDITLSQKKFEEIGKKDVFVTYLYFVNQNYSTLIDLKSVNAISIEDVDLLISNFQKAYDFAYSGEKSEMEFESKELKFRITADGKNGRITLYSTDGAGGYIYIHPKNILKIVNVLKELMNNYNK